MGDFIDDNLGYILAGFFILIIIVAFFSIMESMSAKGAFMEECLQERKQYECTAMWRAGNSRTITVPVIIPVR